VHGSHLGLRQLDIAEPALDDRAQRLRRSRARCTFGIWGRAMSYVLIQCTRAEAVIELNRRRDRECDHPYMRYDTFRKVKRRGGRRRQRESRSTRPTTRIDQARRGQVRGSRASLKSELSLRGNSQKPMGSACECYQRSSNPRRHRLGLTGLLSSSLSGTSVNPKWGGWSA
jgi:hypothetical protein